MSLSERLSSGIGGFGEALFGSGPNQYARGRLFASRIGASDASRAFKESKTRDLDYAHENKVSLIDRFKAEAGIPGADPAIQMKLNALLSNEGMNDYTSGAIKAGEYGSKLSAIDALSQREGIDPNFVDLIRAGVTTPALTAGRLQETPLKVQGLKDKNNLANQLGLLQQNSESALGDLRHASKNKYLAGEADVDAGVGRDEDTAKEFDEVMKQFKENPNKELTPYQSYVLNRGRGGDKVTGGDLTKASTRKSDVSFAKKKLDKIDKEIEKLGMDKQKSEALKKLYVAREEAVRSGKASGNVAITQAGSILKSLTTIKHRNSKGATGQRWGNLTKAEQEEIYFAAIDKAIKASEKLTGGSKVSDALGKTPVSEEDMLNDFKNFVGKK